MLNNDEKSLRSPADEETNSRRYEHCEGAASGDGNASDGDASAESDFEYDSQGNAVRVLISKSTVVRRLNAIRGNDTASTSVPNNNVLHAGKSEGNETRPGQPGVAQTRRLEDRRLEDGGLSVSSGVRPSETPISARGIPRAHNEPVSFENGPSEDVIVVSSAVKDAADERDSSAAPSRNLSHISSRHLNASTSSLKKALGLHGLEQFETQIAGLDKVGLIHLASLVARKAHREVYSMIDFSGHAWYLPTLRAAEPDEVGNFRLTYSSGKGLILIAGQHVLEFHLLGFLIRATYLLLLWFFLWCVLPEPLMSPVGYVFDPLITIIVSSIVGGIICRILQIPPLVGVLLIGIMWNNIPSEGYLTGGIVADVRSIAGRLGLTVVLLRSGFSFSWRSMRPILPNTLLQLFLPMAAEGLVHSAFAHYIFNYEDWTWACLHGFMCTILGGAVIVPGVLMLQSEGYGKDSGPLPLMLAAAGSDTCIGVWICNFLLGLIFSDQPIYLAAILGPVQILGGIMIGVLVATLFHGVVELLKQEAHRLPTGEYSHLHMAEVNGLARYIFVTLAGTMIFFGAKFDLAGGGGVATMVFAVWVSHLWGKDPHNKELMEQRRVLALWLAEFWDVFVMPALFALTGSRIVLRSIFNSDFFPKAIACWFVSNAARGLATLPTAVGLRFSWQERLIHCLAWMGKATAQSALAPVALDAVMKRGAGLPCNAAPLTTALSSAILPGTNVTASLVSIVANGTFQYVRQISCVNLSDTIRSANSQSAHSAGFIVAANVTMQTLYTFALPPNTAGNCSLLNTTTSLDALRTNDSAWANMIGGRSTALTGTLTTTAAAACSAHHRDLQRALNLQNIAIFYVILGAPLAAIVLNKLGPRFLEKTA